MVALGAVALLATGCGGNTSSSPVASASTPTGSTSAGGATQPTWTVEEAGRHYLAMTSKTIADLNRLKALPDSAPLTDLTSGCGDVADDMVSMLAEAQSGNWPTQVQPLMQQWSTAIAEQAHVLRAVLERRDDHRRACRAQPGRRAQLGGRVGPGPRGSGAGPAPGLTTPSAL